MHLQYQLVDTARIAVYLDGSTILINLFNWDSSPQLKYLYTSENILWFFETTSYVALNIKCTYISSTLANLLCAFDASDKGNRAFKSTIKGIAIVLNISQIVIGVVVC